MPTYEYQCRDCGHRVEYFQSMSDPPRTVCPRCKGRLARLVSSGAGIIFKGSGFYVNDYKRPDNGKGARREEPEKGKSGAVDREKASDADD